MNLLPTDSISFIWGLLTAVVAIIISGFFSEVGKDLWQKVKLKPAEDVLVDLRFEPTLYKPEDCRWVNEESLSRYEDEYFYYSHPSNGGKCYRKESKRLSYLMVRNEAKKHNA